MIRAYVDDSYDSNSPLFVLAGYASTEQKWHTFTKEWEHALRGLRLPYFKMAEANGWSEQKKKEFLPYLHNVIAKNVNFGFEVVVDKSALKDQLGGFCDVRASHPYYFCFYNLIQMLTTRERLPGGNGRIRFTFDEQIMEKNFILRNWEKFISYAPAAAKGRISGRVTFADDKNVIPLQAADFRAWQVRNMYSRQYCGDNSDYILLKPQCDVPVISRHCGPQELYDFRVYLESMIFLPRRRVGWGVPYA